MSGPGHRLALPVLAVLCAGPLAAAPCEPGQVTLDRGETHRLVICADSAVSSVYPPPGIAIGYQQPLRRCAVGDSRPGVQLALVAAADASSGELSLLDADGRPACGPVPVTVHDRILLPGATLSERGAPGRYRLTVPAPSGVDLRPACETGLEFPAGDGLSLSADAEGPPLRCSRRGIEASVRALNARTDPARIVLPRVRGTGGERTGVAFATAPPPAWTRDMAPEDARYALIDGVRTRYFVAGEGEALVLVHGGQPSSMDGTAWDWQQNFGELARHFRVYALDRIGQGYTDNPADLDEYADYYPRVVRHVRAFLDAMNITRVHLVGHSQGSWPVTRIALDEPQRVATLTLVDGTMVAPPHEIEKALRFYMYLSMQLHPPTGETLESARRGMELFSHSRNNITPQRVERLVAMTRQPKYAASQDWFAKKMMSPAHPTFRTLKAQINAELEAGRLQVPVQVIWGLKDPEGSFPAGLELFRMVAAGNGRARMHVFGNGGHVSFMEYPQEFNQLLIDFAGHAGP